MPKITKSQLLKIENHEEFARKMFPEEEGYKIKPEKGFEDEIYIVINDHGDEACVFGAKENPTGQEYKSFFGKKGVEYIFAYQSGQRLLILKEDIDDLARLKVKFSKIPWTQDGITRTFQEAVKKLKYGNFESFDELFERKEITKKFYEEYITEFEELMEGINGIDDFQEKRYFAQILADRLIFLQFLQIKNLLNKNPRFLQELNVPPHEWGGVYV